MNELYAMFEPKSVAVIGASRRESSVGHAVLANLINGGFPGKVFPVNPKAEEILGLTCYATILEAPYEIDLAVISVVSVGVPEVMRQCAEKGVRAVVIISSGFREIGKEGRKLEDEVIGIARKNNIALLGPNCLGLINTNPKISLNASFSSIMPGQGNISFISQSGALCTAILDYVRDKHIGFSKFISMGNKAGINEKDLLNFLLDDPQTDVILMYVEDLSLGQEFIEAARRVSAKKPVLVIKSGRTEQGAKAASSHTGSMIGSDEVYDAIFMQSGILRFDSIAEIFNYAIAFANQSLPKSTSVAILTNAGGPGIIATDACIRNGLKMAEFQEATTRALKACLPAAANYANPIDVIGDARHDRYENVLRHLIADDNVDSIIILLTPQAMTNCKEIAEVIVEYTNKTAKTILTCFIGSIGVADGVKVLESNSIPHYTFPEDAASSLAAMVQYKDVQGRSYGMAPEYEADKERVDGILEDVKQSNNTFLPIHLSMDVLKSYGFPLLPYGVGKSGDEVVSIAKEVGFPCVLKILSQDIVHKVDVGGVRLNLHSEDDVASAYKDMMAQIAAKLPKAAIDGVFVQAMAEGGKEVILGMNRDPQFGPVLMFGLGGIYVETFKDVSFRLAPLQHFDAEDMIQSIRTYQLLKGVRGDVSSDIETIVQCLERLSQLSCKHDLINEIDINPLMVYQSGAGARVVDARIVLR